jgi:hypothetical protein
VRLRSALGEGDAARRNLLVVNRSGEGGCHAVTLEEMAKINLRPRIVIPFRRKLVRADGLVQHGRFGEAVAALATEISGRSPSRRPWWRLAK